MKRIYILFFLVIFLVSLVSCGNNDFYKILDDYFNKECLTINEVTEGTLKSNQIIYSQKSSNCILNEYFNSEINYNSKSGYVYYQNNSFYYSYDTTFKILDFDFTTIYNPLGIEALFKTTDFTYKDNIAKKIVKNPKTLEYETLFKNIELDFDLDLEYNKIQPFDIEIKINKNKIEYIKFDLVRVFSNDFNYLTKTFTFEEQEFNKKDYSEDIKLKLDSLINKNYQVNTLATLDTYMLEMIYQYGDSIYIKSGEFDMLIDAGQYEDGQNINRMLEQYCEDDILDVLIATHGHGDHLGGFANHALASIDKINLIIDYGYSSSDVYCNIRDNFINLGADYYCAYDCVKNVNGASKIYQFSDDLSIEILNTNQYAKKNSSITSSDNENDYSVVLLLNFKENKYLYTGDISGDDGLFIDSLLLEDIKDVTVYKVAHHGAISHNTNTQDFLNYINPDICLISAAIIDSYNPYNPLNIDSIQHPRFECIYRMLSLPKIKETKNIYFNGTMGTIHLIDDGITIPKVLGFGPTKGYYINGIKVTNEENLKFTETQFYINR